MSIFKKIYSFFNGKKNNKQNILLPLIYSKKSIKKIWFDEQNLREHIFVLGTTGEGMSFNENFELEKKSKENKEILQTSIPLSQKDKKIKV